MASEVEICNMALSHIRAGSINSLTEASLQAQQCKLWYPFARDRLLTDEAWNFNRSIKALAALTVDIFNWAYSYQYPSDCLKIHRLIGEFEEIAAGSADVISRAIDSQILPISNLRGQIPYEIFNDADNKILGANSANLRIDYAKKITDPNLFTNDFIIALSYLLASYVAVPIVGAEQGRELRSDSLQLYKVYLDAAIASDMNEQYIEPVESEFVTIRR